MSTHAVVRICCDRADGVEYFDSYEEAATWRREYEGVHETPFTHYRTGVLLAVDRDEPPVRVGLEDHQLWVWMRGAEVPHWEVVGTGAL